MGGTWGYLEVFSLKLKQYMYRLARPQKETISSL